MNALQVLSSPWAIVPVKLAEIRDIYVAHMRGPKVDWKGMEARILAAVSANGGQEDDPYEIVNGVAIIPVQGVMTKGRSLFSYLFSGCNTRRKAQAFRQAAEDPAVTAILAYFDTPGGTVDGTQEFSSAIASCRGKKPIVAFSDGMICSAGYWAASACDKRYISGDTVEIGSIGTVYTHVDQSKWDEQIGDKYTEICAGKYKRIASIHKPLSSEGKAYLQEQVDYLNAIFVNDVARNLGVTEDRALEMADEARIYIGRQAIDAGLVDGVSTFDALIERLTAGDAARRVYFTAQTTTEGADTMDVAELKEKHPAVYQAVFDAGKAEGHTAGHQGGLEAGRTEGIATGAAQERKRIADVQALAIPGHEALIASMIADGTEPAAAAVKIIGAEKALREARGEQAKADAAELDKLKAGDYVPPAGGGETAKDHTEAGDKLNDEAKKIQAETKCGYGEAFTKAKAAHPKLAAIYDGKEV